LHVLVTFFVCLVYIFDIERGKFDARRQQILVQILADIINISRTNLQAYVRPMLSDECFDVGCFKDATDDEGDQGIDVSKAEKLSPVPNIN
jgi:hypothetical protein